MTGHLAENQRLAGLDAHAGELEMRAGAGQCRLDKVEFARRNSPVMRSRSASAAWASAVSRARALSAAVGNIQGSPPAATTIAASMGPFELRIWPGGGQGLDRHNLVAGGENGHTGPGEDLERGVAARCRQCHLRSANRCPGASSSSPLRACAP